MTDAGNVASVSFLSLHQFSSCLFSAVFFGPQCISICWQTSSSLLNMLLIHLYNLQCPGSSFWVIAASLLSKQLNGVEHPLLLDLLEIISSLVQMVQDNLDCNSSVTLVIMLSLQDLLRNNLYCLLAGLCHVVWNLDEAASTGVQQTPAGCQPRLTDHP